MPELKCKIYEKRSSVLTRRLTLPFVIAALITPDSLLAAERHAPLPDALLGAGLRQILRSDKLKISVKLAGKDKIYIIHIGQIHENPPLVGKTTQESVEIISSWQKRIRNFTSFSFRVCKSPVFVEGVVFKKRLDAKFRERMNKLIKRVERLLKSKSFNKINIDGLMQLFLFLDNLKHPDRYKVMELAYTTYEKLAISGDDKIIDLLLYLNDKLASRYTAGKVYYSAMGLFWSGKIDIYGAEDIDLNIEAMDALKDYTLFKEGRDELMDRIRQTDIKSSLLENILKQKGYSRAKLLKYKARFDRLVITERENELYMRIQAYFKSPYVKKHGKPRCVPVVYGVGHNFSNTLKKWNKSHQLKFGVIKVSPK